MDGHTTGCGRLSQLHTQFVEFSRSAGSDGSGRLGRSLFPPPLGTRGSGLAPHPTSIARGDRGPQRHGSHGRTKRQCAGARRVSPPAPIRPRSARCLGEWAQKDLLPTRLTNRASRGLRTGAGRSRAGSLGPRGSSCCPGWRCRAWRCPSAGSSSRRCRRGR
jgi:hypothetical protein